MNAPRLRPPSLVESFNYAFQGIIHVLRTQRNMRIHFLVAIGVLIAALVTGVRKIELIALLLAIAFVLIATVTAVAVGYLVFAERIRDPSLRLLDGLRDAPFELTLIALVLTIFTVIFAKAYTGRGTPLRGGLPSGHAAVAFAGWMAVTYLLGNERYWFLVSTVTFIMALLVAQTRIEAGVHSFFEVFLGGLLGALVTLVIFQVFWA